MRMDKKLNYDHQEMENLSHVIYKYDEKEEQFKSLKEQRKDIRERKMIGGVLETTIIKRDATKFRKIDDEFTQNNKMLHVPPNRVLDQKATITVAAKNNTQVTRIAPQDKRLRRRFQENNSINHEGSHSTFVRGGKNARWRGRDQKDLLGRQDSTFRKHMMKTRNVLDQMTVKPLKTLLSQLEGKKQAQMEDMGGESLAVSSGIVTGVVNAAIAVVKLSIMAISALTSIISTIVASISATAIAIFAVVLIIILVIVAVILSNPVIARSEDMLHVLKYTCDTTLSSEIEDTWANKFPVHSKLELRFNDSDQNRSNYAEVLAVASQIADGEEIDKGLIAEILKLLTHIDYSSDDYTTLIADIRTDDIAEIQLSEFYRTRGKQFNHLELDDLIEMYFEALQEIGGNKYDIYVPSPSLITEWKMPFFNDAEIRKRFGVIDENIDEHWVVFYFDEISAIDSISNGLVSYINKVDGKMLVRYVSGVLLEFNGDIIFDQSLEVNQLVSSGSTLFHVKGELSTKLLIDKGSSLLESIKDLKTGETIIVQMLSYDDQLASVDLLSYVKYKIAQDEGQDGLRHRIVSEAISYLGTPYVLGGSTHSGIDCSGLTMVVYNTMTHGTPYATHLTHGSRAQDTPGQGGAAVFDHIYVCWRRAHRSGGLTYEERMSRMNEDLARLKPGDLLFFWNEQTIGSSLNNHVGIYIGKNQSTGKHEFIHATTQPGRVIISDMMNYPFWPGRARRPIWP